MVEARIRASMDFLGISLSRTEEDVLAAIMKTCQTQHSANFEDIAKRLENTDSATISKQWIYQCLSKLEELKLIEVDRGFPHDPTEYVASIITLRSGFNIAIKDRYSELAKKEKDLQMNIEKLKSIEPAELASHLIEEFSFDSTYSRPIVVQGITSVRNLIETEICDKCNRGDIVRICGDFNMIGTENSQQQSIENRFLEESINGVIIRALFQIDEDNIEDIIENNMDIASLHRESISEAIEAGHLNLRAFTPDISTYRFISLNSEKMVLFLTGAKEPDAVALFTRSNRARMLDDALTSFDDLWTEAEDLNETVFDYLESL